MVLASFSTTEAVRKCKDSLTGTAGIDSRCQLPFWVPACEAYILCDSLHVGLRPAAVPAGRSWPAKGSQDTNPHRMGEVKKWLKSTIQRVNPWTMPCAFFKAQGATE